MIEDLEIKILLPLLKFYDSKNSHLPIIFPHPTIYSKYLESHYKLLKSIQIYLSNFHSISSQTFSIFKNLTIYFLERRKAEKDVQNPHKKVPQVLHRRQQETLIHMF